MNIVTTSSSRLHRSIPAEEWILQATVGRGRPNANITAKMLQAAGDLLRILCNSILISGSEAILPFQSIANFQYLGSSGQMKRFDGFGSVVHRTTEGSYAHF